MGDTVKQRCSDFGFKITDLLAEWRLTNADLGCCTGEVAFAGDGQKIADMTQFHDWYIQKISRLTVSYIGRMAGEVQP